MQCQHRATALSNFGGEFARYLPFIVCVSAVNGAVVELDARKLFWILPALKSD